MPKKKKPKQNQLDWRNPNESIQSRIQSDPEFAKFHAAAMAQIEALDNKLLTRRERLKQLANNSAGYTLQDRAARWLRFVLEDWESYGELEAIVYLASRDVEHHAEARDVLDVWTRAEQRSIKRCASGETSVGMSITEAADIDNRPPHELIDFWDSRSGPYPTEATMLRVVEWCGITGFEPWWTRFARESRENVLLGGPVPRALVRWLFDMCRCAYAFRLMNDTLQRALDAVCVTGTFRRQPWIYGHEKLSPAGGREYVFDEDLEYTAALAWCATRIGRRDERLVHDAISTLAKRQLQNGAWADSTAAESASIGVTAMAIHAIAAVGHPRSAMIVADAARWLTEQQAPAGYWTEDGDPNPVRLTVLVLDALELAAGGMRTTLKPLLEREAKLPASSPSRKEMVMSQTFNVHGPNARLNIGSTDQSTNIVHHGTPFSDIRNAIETGIAEGAERTILLSKLADLESATDREDGSIKYTSFIAAAANHVTLLGPFLPALGHWVHGLLSS